MKNLEPTPTETIEYQRLFNLADSTKTGIITPQEAVGFLSKSKCSQQVLMVIWDLADSKKQGSLDQNGFYIACKLIAAAQSGLPITVDSLTKPTPLPDLQQELSAEQARSILLTSGSDVQILAKVWANVNPTGSSTVSIKQINEAFALLKEYQEPSFDLLDKDKKGYLTGEQVYPVFLKSGLAQQELARIWDATQENGKLSALGFKKAMQMIKAKLEYSNSSNKDLLDLEMPVSTPTISPAIPNRTSMMPLPVPSLEISDLAEKKIELTSKKDEILALQNSLKTLSIQEIQQQKKQVEDQLKTVLKEKQDLTTKVAQARILYETEVAQYKEIQEQLILTNTTLEQGRVEYSNIQATVNMLLDEKRNLQDLLVQQQTEIKEAKAQIQSFTQDIETIKNDISALRAQVKQQQNLVDVNQKLLASIQQEHDGLSRDRSRERDLLQHETQKAVTLARRKSVQKAIYQKNEASESKTSLSDMSDLGKSTDNVRATNPFDPSYSPKPPANQISPSLHSASLSSNQNLSPQITPSMPAQSIQSISAAPKSPPVVPAPISSPPVMPISSPPPASVNSPPVAPASITSPPPASINSPPVMPINSPPTTTIPTEEKPKMFDFESAFFDKELKPPATTTIDATSPAFDFRPDPFFSAFPKAATQDDLNEAFSIPSEQDSTAADLAKIMDLGFTKEQAKNALETYGSVEKAVNALLD